MGHDDIPIYEAKDEMRWILNKFPEAKSELKHMICELDRGESVVLCNVRDLESRFRLTKVFNSLRLEAAERKGGDKSFRRNKMSVVNLRKSFSEILGITQVDYESDSSSSSSSSDRKKKKKKKSKKSKKSSKKKKKDKKKKKKKKRRRSTSSSSDESDQSEIKRTNPVNTAPVCDAQQVLQEKPVQAPVAAPQNISAPDSDSDDDFGPQMSFKQLVGEQAAANYQEPAIIRSAKQKEKQRDPQANWIMQPPQVGSQLGSIINSAESEEARAAWMATPEERFSEEGKQKRARERAQREAIENLAQQRQDNVNNKNLAQYESSSSSRGKSLMEIHQEIHVNDPKPAAWDRERDFDSGKVDTKRLMENVANPGARLRSRFAQGKEHFLQ